MGFYEWRNDRAENVKLAQKAPNITVYLGQSAGIVLGLDGGVESENHVCFILGNKTKIGVITPIVYSGICLRAKDTGGGGTWWWYNGT